MELTSNPPTTVGEEEDLDNLLDMEDSDNIQTHVEAVPLLMMSHHPDETTAVTLRKLPLQTALLNLKIIFPIAIQAQIPAIGPTTTYNDGALTYSNALTLSRFRLRWWYFSKTTGPEISGHVTQISVFSPYTSWAGLYEQQWESGSSMCLHIPCLYKLLSLVFQV